MWIDNDRTSKCRNERLAVVFYRLNLVESYGTGLRKILNHYPDLKVSDIVAVSDHAFRLRLPIENAKGVQMGNVLSSREKRQKTILDLLGLDGVITRKIIQEKTGCSVGTAIRDLEELQKIGKLKKRGNGRNSEYVSA